jgi:hypothetical protein
MQLKQPAASRESELAADIAFSTDERVSHSALRRIGSAA